MVDSIENLQNVVEEQKKLIANLSRNYLSIFEHSKVGIVFVNKNGTFIDTNKKFSEIVGYSRRELLFLRFADITYEEDLEKDLSIHIKTQEDNTDCFTLEKRYIRKDGKIIWVEIFINHVRDEKGNFLHTLGFVTDISKRKKIQDTILEQTKTMQLYLDIVDVMIVAINRHGNTSLVNRKTCEVLGLDEHKILGRNWFNNFIFENDRDIAIDSYLKIINKEMDLSEKVQYQIICKNGELRTIIWRRAYIFDEHKNILGMISSGEDITNLLKLEEENKKSEEALFNQSKLASMGEMLRNIAHQWRQPLSTISIAASGVKLQKEMGILKDKEFDISMTAIVDTTQYLSQTIDDFQNFFKMVNVVDDFSCTDLFEKIKSLISSSYKSYDINLDISYSGQSRIRGPYNEIIQVILNILNNAKDAFVTLNLDHRFVFIEESFKDNSLHITIKDNAGGIPKEIIDRIFEPYFTTKHQSLGTGIGLYMVKDIIENRLKGSIKVFNKIIEYNGIKREGAVFELVIPNPDD